MHCLQVLRGAKELWVGVDHVLSLGIPPELINQMIEIYGVIFEQIVQQSMQKLESMLENSEGMYVSHD
jgi:hypothetical protein